MSTVFEHRDVDGDTFRVSEWQMPGVLSFEVDPVSDSTFANMGRDAVLSLIQALTEWAYPAHTPEGPNRSLIEELIAKAVKDQVSAVLPLHLSPVAVRDPYCHLPNCGWGSCTPHPDGCTRCKPVATCRGEYGCDALGEHPAYGSGCGRPDPEPGDVGHPRPPAAEPACTCIHWVGWHGTRGCTAPGCECRSTGGVTEPSDVGHPRPPVESVPEECTHCNHRWGNHNAQGCQLSACTCTKSQVAEDGPCGESMRAGQRLSEPHDACGFIWALHKVDPPQACSTSRAPLPVREKTVIIPVCGLCKQPWNDGHGQPGDPCPGVEAARQHPGDWTDALWRVQPSAPASETRYCDECGHSWESYLPIAAECAAIKGKGTCGCTRRPE